MAFGEKYNKKKTWTRTNQALLYIHFYMIEYLEKGSFFERASAQR